ncbi:MAG TPA: hypothetical protein VFJ90_08100, partial [Candidatus Didemnitutus sp.]|nr:hypothetical protein [Candidatus Didemnitutus sp.]
GAVEWLEPKGDSVEVRQVLDASNSRVEVTALLSNGSPAGAPASAAWPVTLPPLARIAVLTSVPLGGLPERDAILRLRNAAGDIVAEAIFRH